jgi:hypothetical protein
MEVEEAENKWVDDGKSVTTLGKFNRKGLTLLLPLNGKLMKEQAIA